MESVANHPQCTAQCTVYSVPPNAQCTVYSVQCTITVTVSSMHATNDVMKISCNILCKYNFMIQLKFSAARAIHV